MQTLTDTIDLTGCTVSEKYDGIQARWDGHTLTTRTGNAIHAPAWWTINLPNRPAVGELWAGRGTFETLQSIVCRDTPDERWHMVKFMDFDAIDQTPIESTGHLDDFFNNVVAKGGEGVVVTTADGGQFKQKPVDDDDGRLVDFIPGAGRNTGMVGAMVLRTRDDRTVKISAGLTHRLRTTPPRIGAIIRFKFNGRTRTGAPRFARFDGVRAETSLDF